MCFTLEILSLVNYLADTLLSVLKKYRKAGQQNISDLVWRDNNLLRKYD